MAIDEKDKSTGKLNLETRGRKPKLRSGAMSPAERKAAERARRAAEGESQLWLKPDELELVMAWREDPDILKSIKSHFQKLMDDGIPMHDK